MTARELIEQCEIQSQVHFCYYDYDKLQRVEFLCNSYLMNCEVRFMYVDDGDLYIEVEKDD